jgi:hypothetical protein
MSVIKTFDNVLTEQERLAIIDEMLMPGVLVTETEVNYHRSIGRPNLGSSLVPLPKIHALAKSIYGDQIEFNNSYCRIYYNTSFLGIHSDRKRLDITMSVCLLKEFEHEWPLHISRVPFEGEYWDYKVKDTSQWQQDYTSHELEENQAVICEGKKYPHWRETLECEDSKRAFYVFYHWRRKFPYQLMR